MKVLTHLDSKGRLNMVDVSDKIVSNRAAKAAGFIRLRPETVALIKAGRLAKGNVAAAAEIAGIQAAKKTADLIPLCHPISLTGIRVRINLAKDRATATSEVKCAGKTGVEMEALTAVAAALLTIYDMCKAVDRDMEIGGVRLVEKTKTVPKP